MMIKDSVEVPLSDTSLSGGISKQKRFAVQWLKKSNQTVFIINSKAELLSLPQIRRRLSFLKKYNSNTKWPFATESLINCKMR